MCNSRLSFTRGNNVRVDIRVHVSRRLADLRGPHHVSAMREKGMQMKIELEEKLGEIFKAKVAGLKGFNKIRTIEGKWLNNVNFIEIEGQCAAALETAYQAMPQPSAWRKVEELGKKIEQIQTLLDVYEINNRNPHLVCADIFRIVGEPMPLPDAPGRE